ncbi:MAG TPA: hypothetical protein VGG39_08755 [Polyangiaceae bacterium]|jgi:hypothetical protein
MPNTPTSTALARTPTQEAIASFNRITRDPSSIAAAIEKAQAVGHLVAPSTSISGGVPEGTSIAFSAVMVDIAHETYPIPGSSAVGLGKTALDRIALALGVSWTESRRLDDGRDPHYAEFLAVGVVRQYDGTPITIQATKVLDWRDKAPAVESLWAKYREKHAAWERGGRQGDAPRSPEAQIREVRGSLAARCETSARLRAVRSLGIRTSYGKDELRKPFIAARLIFSGDSEDPSLRREFALMRASAFLDSSRSLYGEPRAPRLPAGSPAPARVSAHVPAPPVGSTTADEDDELLEGELVSPTTMPPGRDTGPAAFVGQDPAPSPTPARPVATPSRCPRCDGGEQVCPTCKKLEGPHADCSQAMWIPCPSCCSSRDGAGAATTGARPATRGNQRPDGDDRPRREPSSAVVRFGRDKGKQLSQVEDLSWYLKAIGENVDDPSKDRYREDNLRHLEEIKDEIARRDGGDDDFGELQTDEDVPF